jgi:hypothetical protein
VNFVVAADVHQPFEKRFGSVSVRFVGLDHLPASLKAGGEAAARS